MGKKAQYWNPGIGNRGIPQPLLRDFTLQVIEIATPYINFEVLQSWR
jgi:hypothetical protein